VYVWGVTVLSEKQVGIMRSLAKHALMHTSARSHVRLLARSHSTDTAHKNTDATHTHKHTHTHTHTRTRTHARTHARMHARTQTRAHTHKP